MSSFARGAIEVYIVIDYVWLWGLRYSFRGLDP